MAARTIAMPAQRTILCTSSAVRRNETAWRVRASRLRLMASVALMASFCLAPSASAQCHPNDFEPSDPPSAGCEWWYLTGNLNHWYEVITHIDRPRRGQRDALSPCFCGWYPAHVPCPSNCPDYSTSVSHTDTLQWSVTSTISVQAALSFKWDLIITQLGYIAQWGAQEEQALSGTKTRQFSVNLPRQTIGCFTRYYRTAWTYHKRAGRYHVQWTYLWQEWCNGYPTENKTAATMCDYTTATGSAEWDTIPHYEYAPSGPPCGGVPVSVPDPWDGRREEPCCDTVCLPPPPGQNPCCGCEVVP